ALGGDADGEWRERAVASLRESLDAGRVIGAVAVVDGATVSGAMATVWTTIPGPGHDGRRAWVFGVATDPEHRRQGHARAALGRVLERLDGMGVVKIDLSATTDGEDLYRSLGFEVSPFARMVRRPPGL
ncbi:MAG TPA: GNAT family N-acetyltransferase, partial [Candidatus Nanopelagicales bacterium]|nr:GNAT family N-acetyltransferase [Candidatus Nanopelagicales bacterium]